MAGRPHRSTFIREAHLGSDAHPPIAPKDRICRREEDPQQPPGARNVCRSLCLSVDTDIQVPKKEVGGVFHVKIIKIMVTANVLIHTAFFIYVQYVYFACF